MPEIRMLGKSYQYRLVANNRGDDGPFLLLKIFKEEDGKVVLIDPIHGKEDKFFHELAKLNCVEENESMAERHKKDVENWIKAEKTCE